VRSQGGQLISFSALRKKHTLITSYNSLGLVQAFMFEKLEKAGCFIAC